MKILVFSFYYGSGNASGFATSKIINELASRGHEIVVIAGICSDKSHPSNVRIEICNPKPLSPARFFKWAGNIVGVELNYIFWEIRAKKLGEKIIASFKPDVLYGRSSPISSLTVPAKLKSSSNLPFIAHFADPIPAPKEWVSNVNERNKLIKNIIPVINCADLVSFVTKEMMIYQQESTSLDLKQKSFISPNTISDIQKEIGSTLGIKPILLYLGSFYGNRTPQSLFAGFEMLVDRIPEAEIHLYGSNKDFVEPFITSNVLKEKVKFFPSTNEPFKIMEESLILIDIDGDVEKQVFLSSKFLDYLSVDRYLLSITSENSPASQLVLRMPNSSVRSSHQAEDVANALYHLASKEWSADVFKERRIVMSEFFVTEVAKNIEIRFKNLIKELN